MQTKKQIFTFFTVLHNNMLEASNVEHELQNTVAVEVNAQHSLKDSIDFFKYLRSGVDGIIKQDVIVKRVGGYMFNHYQYLKYCKENNIDIDVKTKRELGQLLTLYRELELIVPSALTDLSNGLGIDAASALDARSSSFNIKQVPQSLVSADRILERHKIVGYTKLGERVAGMGEDQCAIMISAIVEAGRASNNGVGGDLPSVLEGYFASTPIAPHATPITKEDNDLIGIIKKHVPQYARKKRGELTDIIIGAKTSIIDMKKRVAKSAKVASPIASVALSPDAVVSPGALIVSPSTGPTPSASSRPSAGVETIGSAKFESAIPPQLQTRTAVHSAVEEVGNTENLVPVADHPDVKADRAGGLAEDVARNLDRTDLLIAMQPAAVQVGSIAEGLEFAAKDMGAGDTFEDRYRATTGRNSIFRKCCN